MHSKWVVLRAVVVLAIMMVGIMPAAAQDGSSHRVTFDGFSFSFDSALAANVNIVPVPGDPLDYPGGPQAPYTEFVLHNALPSPQNWFELENGAVGGIRIYRVAEMAGYTDYKNRLEVLQDMLATRPDLTPYMAVTENVSDITLPFLPVLPAGQVIRAQAEYMDTDSVSGVRFITVYAEALEPFLADTFFYTFQGISADGSAYVSVLFWVRISAFPATLPADMDWDAFYADYMAYLTESVATLNAAAPGEFVPSLDTLDGIVGSFAFEG